MKVDAQSGKYRIVAEINMIPFIDVSLVLLIIFMVMTPFLVRSQIKVVLPAAGSADTEAYDAHTLRVQVEKNGFISVDGQRVHPGSLETTLRRQIRDPKNQPLIIEADKDVPFQHVVVVLDASKKIGALRVGVCVKQASEGAARRP